MVRTRFAPSPTGYLHIGGVRTALFNWLFARHHQGRFVLRIDDTDQQRNVDAALQPILDGFRWLGLDWDEGPEVGGPYGPYFQSQRAERYQQAVAMLLECGAAYYDFATPEELAAERDAAQQAGIPFQYSRQWMAEDERTRETFAGQGRPQVVRLKMPREGELVLQDLIRGSVRFQWSQEADHVIQRADGTCLYHLATVVDDHDFEITHVIRAEEHLSNTPRQWFIAKSLGFAPPQFAHVPFVAEPGSRTKLSKRKLAKYLKHRDFAKLNEQGQRIAHRLGLPTDPETFNPVIVDFYRQVGFLPESLLNYLVLLGWSLDDRTEFLTLPQMIEHFSLDRVNKSPASFDPQKLMAFQAHYMQQRTEQERTELVIPFLQRAGLIAQSVAPESVAAEIRTKVQRIVAAAGDRIVIAGDILDYDYFFLSAEQIQYDPKAWEKRLRKPAEAAELLRQFARRLQQIAPFTADVLERELKTFVDEQAIKMGQIIHALRVAVTGTSVGFGVFETVAILGRDESVRRIQRALDLLSVHEKPSES